MDDTMRPIRSNDLSISINIPAANLAASSDEAATSPTSAEPAPVCEHCRGIGYYLFAVPYGHPQFAQLHTCHCRASEKQKTRREILVQMSNIGPFGQKTFENFDAGVNGVVRAYTRARNFAKQPQGWLIFFGGYGSGKTHLAAAIANELLHEREPAPAVLFTIVPDLLDHLRSTFGPSSEIAYDERVEQIRNAQVLILDDLGTENATPWAREKLFQILNHRYNYQLPTVITSNREPKELDPRLFSRMSDRELCDEITMIDAGDYRRTTPNQRFEQKKQAHLRRMGRKPT